MRMYYGEACQVASTSWEHDTETLRKALDVIENKRGDWTQSDLLEAARSLATKPGDPPNTEYDRAIVELVASTIPGMASLYADAPELATELVLGRAANKS